MELIFHAAGIKREKRLGWHGCRRQWATSRRGNSLPDLAVAGGLKWLAALMRYLQTDDEEIARIILAPTH